MTLHLDIPEEMERRLQEHADSSGKDLRAVVLDALQEKLNSIASLEPARRLGAWDDFIALAEEHTRSLPSGHKVDDRRESFYEGRGE